MRARFEQGGNLRGAVRLTSIEGVRPAQSVKPSADDMAPLSALVDRVRTSDGSSTVPREPQPGDGPDYHAEHAAGVARNVPRPSEEK